MSWQQSIPILQVAVEPVILISGVSLLPAGMTNRLGRLVDRSRSLVHAAIALACLGALIAALLFFFRDIHGALVALRLETTSLLALDD